VSESFRRGCGTFSNNERPQPLIVRVLKPTEIDGHPARLGAAKRNRNASAIKASD